MDPAQVTIIVVPRERFSNARASLESVLAHTPVGVSLVYVDGGSPRRVRKYLEEQSREWSFKLVQTDCYLTPNESRNRGLREARGQYVVFVDNDIIVTPGWLDELVRCAQESGAWVVGPLYCEGRPEDGVIHMAGGEAHIRARGEERLLHEWHRFEFRKLADVAPQLRREPTEVVEFHCMLVRCEVFERLGLLDEGFMSVHEHVDFCMSVRNAGGAVYLEPAAVVTYVTASPFAWSDIPYYLLRWSEVWSEASYRHCNAKWRLTEDHRVIHERFVRPHRRLALLPLQHWISRFLGANLGARAVDAIEQALVNRGLRKRAGLQRVPGAT